MLAPFTDYYFSALAFRSPAGPLTDYYFFGPDSTRAQHSGRLFSMEGRDGVRSPVDGD